MKWPPITLAVAECILCMVAVLGFSQPACATPAALENPDNPASETMASPTSERQDRHAEPEETTTAGALLAAGSVVLGDIEYLVTAPSRLDGKGAIMTAGVLAVVGGVMAFDSNIRQWTQNNRTEAATEVFKSVRSVGHLALPVNAGLAAGGYLFRRTEQGNKLFHTSLVSLEAQGLAGGLSYLTKLAVGRNRPRQDPQGNSYDPFKEFGRSFPSGHATQLFALAAVFADQYPFPVQALLYTLATVVGAERVYQNHHFASDVLGGAVIGYVVGKALAWRHAHGNKGLSFMPVALAGGAGVVLEYRF